MNNAIYRPARSIRNFILQRPHINKISSQQVIFLPYCSENLNHSICTNRKIVWVIIAHLQISLRSCTWMLWPLHTTERTVTYRRNITSTKNQKSYSACKLSAEDNIFKNDLVITTSFINTSYRTVAEKLRWNWTLSKSFQWDTYHSFVSMWEKNNNAALSNPLGLATADELVKDALCVVGKVTKLSFPENKSIRVAHRVT